MLSIISSLLESSYFRKGLFIVVLLAILTLGGYKFYNHVYDSGKDAGIAYQTQLYSKQQQDAKELLDKQQVQADKDRSDLNSQISDLKNENTSLQTALDKKYSQQSQKVTDYAKTTDGTQSCFAPDSDGLRIINESFPDSN